MSPRGGMPMGGMGAGGMPTEGGGDPRALLEQAIALHRGHLDGATPVDPQSQAELMDLLERALAALGGSAPPPPESGGMMMNRMMRGGR